MSREFRRAVADDLRILALLHERELTADILVELRGMGFPTGLGLQLVSPGAESAAKLWAEAWRQIPEAPGSELLDQLAADYAAIYLNHTHRASPQESVWLDDDQLLMQGPTFAVRQWHRRFSVRARQDRLTEDHIASELGFLAFLFDSDDATLQDCADFMDEHPLRWVGEFAERVSRACGTTLYSALAQLSAAYLEELRGILVQDVDIPRPSPEALAKRLAPEASPPPLPPPAHGPGSGPTW